MAGKTIRVAADGACPDKKKEGWPSARGGAAYGSGTKKGERGFLAAAAVGATLETSTRPGGGLTPARARRR